MRSSATGVSAHQPDDVHATAHHDTFARDNLPPQSEWPDFRFTRPELQYPPRLNCVSSRVISPDDGSKCDSSDPFAPNRTSG